MSNSLPMRHLLPLDPDPQSPYSHSPARGDTTAPPPQTSLLLRCPLQLSPPHSLLLPPTIPLISPMAAAAAEGAEGVVHLPFLEVHPGVGVAERFPQSRRLQSPPMGTVKEEEEEEEEGVAEHRQELVVVEAVVPQLIPSPHFQTSVGLFRAPGGLPVGDKKAFLMRGAGYRKRFYDGFIGENTRRGG